MLCNVLYKLSVFLETVSQWTEPGQLSGGPALPGPQQNGGQLPAPVAPAPPDVSMAQTPKQPQSMEREPSSGKKSGAAVKASPTPPVPQTQPTALRQAPDGAPVYGNSSTFSPDNMTIPPKKRRKQTLPNEPSAAPSTPAPNNVEPVAAAPARQNLTTAQPSIMEPKKEPPQPAPKVDYPHKCPVYTCDGASTGFETQALLADHLRVQHEHNGDDLEYCLHHLRKALNVEKPPPPTGTNAKSVASSSTQIPGLKAASVLATTQSTRSSTPIDAARQALKSEASRSVSRVASPSPAGMAGRQLLGSSPGKRPLAAEEDRPDAKRAKVDHPKAPDTSSWEKSHISQAQLESTFSNLEGFEDPLWSWAMSRKRILLSPTPEPTEEEKEAEKNKPIANFTKWNPFRKDEDGGPTGLYEEFDSEAQKQWNKEFAEQDFEKMHGEGFKLGNRRLGDVVLERYGVQGVVPDDAPFKDFDFEKELALMDEGNTGGEASTGDDGQVKEGEPQAVAQSEDMDGVEMAGTVEDMDLDGLFE